MANQAKYWPIRPSIGQEMNKFVAKKHYIEAFGKSRQVMKNPFIGLILPSKLVIIKIIQNQVIFSTLVQPHLFIKWIARFLAIKNEMT